MGMMLPFFNGKGPKACEKGYAQPFSSDYPVIIKMFKFQVCVNFHLLSSKNHNEILKGNVNCQYYNYSLKIFKYFYHFNTKYCSFMGKN